MPLISARRRIPDRGFDRTLGVEIGRWSWQLEIGSCRGPTGRPRSGAEREAPCESADVESMDPTPDHSGTDPCDPPPTRDGRTSLQLPAFSFQLLRKMGFLESWQLAAGSWLLTGARFTRDRKSVV